MELIQSACLKPDQAATMIANMVDFVNACIAAGTLWIGRVLRKYENIFRELQYDFPNLLGLPCITTYIAATSCKDANTTQPPSLIASRATPFNEVTVTVIVAAKF